MKQVPFLFLADGYKFGHYKQYPKGTQVIFSNFTGRNGRNPLDTGYVFFGLQYFLQKYIMEVAEETFFNQPLDKVLEEYGDFQVEYFGSEDARDTQHIENLWYVGYLPLEFRALPEGTFVPYGVPCLTIKNTYENEQMSWLTYWVTNYIETLMSSVLWLPCTSATTALQFHKILNYWCVQTGGDPEMVKFRGHDFSMRGMQGPEAAMLSGMGHLTSFVGTDTVPAVWALKEYYDAEGLIGVSVPATEHSVVCAGGEGNEKDTILRLLETYPTGILSYVADTWNLWDLLTITLRDAEVSAKIMGRDGTFVVRPDSGDPLKILCGDAEAPVGSPARKGVYELLFETFGGTKTETGHIKLDSHINVIYGDGINLALADGICKRLADNGFCPDMVFGIGSFTYTYVTRDTHGFAMKATDAVINGEEKQLHKKPITDNGGKFSAKGMLGVELQDNKLVLVDGMSQAQWTEFQVDGRDQLQLVWSGGNFDHRTTLDEVRALIATQV